MAKMNHEQKKRLAKKLLTLAEIKAKTPKFDSKAWTLRKKDIAKKHHATT